jgi:hypothetical protein
MKPGRERGMLLLPVALVLAMAGIAAYAVTREGGMSVSAVNARYEYEAARYLAEAGVNLAVWQNAKRNCSAPVFDPVQLGGGTIGMDGAIGKAGPGALGFTVLASYGGATYRIDRSSNATRMQFYDLSKKSTASIKPKDGSDTFIKQGINSDNHSQKYIEVSDAAGANANGLIEFAALGPIDKFGTRVVQANLELSLNSVAVAALPRSLAVHRVLRDWPDNTTWTTPWTTAGGDYFATPATVVPIVDINTRYVFPILNLTRDWIRNPAQNFGVLLKATGMNTARFESNEGSGTQPLLVATYYPACP